jgi:hypothetical protein
MPFCKKIVFRTAKFQNILRKTTAISGKEIFFAGVTMLFVAIFCSILAYFASILK